MSTLSPTQCAQLRSIIEAFDAAIERERTRWGAASAEQMRAKGVGLADVNVGLDRPISLRAAHALAERGLLRVETARNSESGLRRGSFGRWIGGSVQREFVTARVTPTEEGRRQIAAVEVASMVDQLWIVFLDGGAQKDVLPYAGSEEAALSLWREQAGLGQVARARLRAVPKADDRAATALTLVRDIAYRLRDEDEEINGADFLDYVSGALDKAGFLAEVRAASRPRFRTIPKKDPALVIVQNIAFLLRDEDEEINGGDFLDYVSGQLDAAGFLAEARASAGSPDAAGRRDPVPRSRPEELTTEQQAALRAWADEHAPRWKAALRLAWETGDYGGSEHDADLQRIRNTLGPSWLNKYRLPVDPDHETKGYRCWVVTSVKPRQVHTWVATRRAEAVSQAKTAVRNNKSEGGVESKDPRDPFEVTFALVRGKLVTTKHTD